MKKTAICFGKNCPHEFVKRFLYTELGSNAGSNPLSQEAASNFKISKMYKNWLKKPRMPKMAKNATSTNHDLDGTVEELASILQGCC